VDGAVLEASLRSGSHAKIVRQGKGEALLPNGDQYSGSWAANVPHGHGAYTYAAVGATYTGEWVEGQRHGRGVLHAVNNDEYDGGTRPATSGS
jgi:hypothetical protein